MKDIDHDLITRALRTPTKVVLEYLRAGGWSVRYWTPQPDSARIEAAGAVSSSAFAQYLLRRGDDSRIYALPADPDNFGRHQLLAELVDGVATTQGRAVDEVWYDIARLPVDEVTVRLQGEDLPDGLPFAEIGEFMGGLKKAVRSAARSAFHRLPFHGRGRPANEVNDILKRVRLAEAHGGSFVAILRSTVLRPLDLQPPPQPTLWDESDELSRKIERGPQRASIAALIAGTDGAAMLAESVRSGEGLDDELMTQAVAEGVAAELCEGLATMVARKGDRGKRSVSMEARWSPLSPPSTESVRPSPIASDLVEELRQIASRLRRHETASEVELYATVVALRLHGKSLDDGGKVEVLVDFRGKQRRASILVDGAQMTSAHHSLGEGARIHLRAKVDIDGSQLRLKNVDLVG